VVNLIGAAALYIYQTIFSFDKLKTKAFLGEFSLTSLATLSTTLIAVSAVLPTASARALKCSGFFTKSAKTAAAATCFAYDFFGMGLLTIGKAGFKAFLPSGSGKSVKPEDLL
jgi:hypothetical protein